MSTRCKVTGKKPLYGNKVSHSNRKTRMRQMPNLQYHRFWVPEEKRWVRLRVSTRAIKIIAKRGIRKVLKELHAAGEAA